MTVSVLVCLAPGSEEMEAVTTIDILARASINVSVASVAHDGRQDILCSRGVRLLADAPLSTFAGKRFDALVLPGGIKGAECFRDSSLLIEIIRQIHHQGNIIAAICAAPALVLEQHHLFPASKMTGFPAMKEKIPASRWLDQRVVYDQDAKLLTSQGPGTAMDFALKLVELLAGRHTAVEVATQLVLPSGVYDYGPTYQSISD